MPLPMTLLAMIYHGAISPYREEMHANFNSTFQRFGVAGGFVRKAILDIDQAAAELRKGEKDGQKHLEAASATLFAHLEYTLAAELASGVPGPDQPIKGTPGAPAGLISSLYLLFYSEKFRKTNPQAPSANIEAAWEGIKPALDGHSIPFATLQPYAAELCKAMKDEFDGDGWKGRW